MANGRVTYDKDPAGDGLYPFTTRASITCNSGYYGPSEETCVYSGNWGHHKPRCDQGNKTANNLLSIFKMFCVYLRKFYYFRNIYVNFMDYIFTHDIFTERCPTLMLLNGTVKYSRSDVNGQYLVNTNATFQCPSGYSVSGSVLRTCQISGNWNGETTTCRGNEVNTLFYFL